jgi:hypothetical protein
MDDLKKPGLSRNISELHPQVLNAESLWESGDIITEWAKESKEKLEAILARLRIALGD